MAVAIATPELSFAHQTSLADSRSTNTPASEAADRGIVAVQLADAAGTAIGNWLKALPYENEYDVQGTDNFSNCTFDPIDDGNNEDSWGPPGDDASNPLRRVGPSSTCMPEFTFAWHGDTDYRNSPGLIDDQHIGRAFDGPPLQGSVDRGTWVRPRISLFNYKGRRLRVRFLASTIEVNPSVTLNDTSTARTTTPGTTAGISTTSR